MTFDSPAFRRQLSSPDILNYPKRIIKEFRLTPIIEDLNDLKIGSSDKKVHDDFDLKNLSHEYDHG